MQGIQDDVFDLQTACPGALMSCAKRCSTGIWGCAVVRQLDSGMSGMLGVWVGCWV